MKKAIVNINIKIPCPDAKTDGDAEIEAENYELPSGYVEDSYKLVKVIEEKEEGEEKKTDKKLKTYKVRWEESRYIIVKAKDEEEAREMALMGEFEESISDEMTAEPEAYEIKE